MAFAFVFPGQGSQTVGMGKALAANFAPAREVFDEVDAALGAKLSAIIFEGPAETLTLTENAQPALMAVSLAAMRVLQAEAGVDLARDAQFVAGHSLGEYSALAASGALSLADTARLLRTRGLAMQKAVPVGVGAMAALLGLDFDVASAVAGEAAQGQVCEAANDNGAGQVVVSGDKAAVERAVEIAKSQRRQARDAAAGIRTLPLRADAACRRGDGGSAGEGEHPAAGRAGRRQCAGQADPRAGRNRARFGGASHRHRALAQVGRFHERAPACKHSMKSAPARS